MVLEHYLILISLFNEISIILTCLSYIDQNVIKPLTPIGLYLDHKIRIKKNKFINGPLVKKCLIF